MWLVKTHHQKLTAPIHLPHHPMRFIQNQSHVQTTPDHPTFPPSSSSQQIELMNSNTLSGDINDHRLMHPEVHEAILQVFPQFPPLVWSLLLPGKVGRMDLSLSNAVYHIVIINQYSVLSISTSIIYHDNLFSLKPFDDLLRTS